MTEISINQVTAALTFKVPKKVGWSVRSLEKSWTGNDLDTLVNYLAQEGSRSMTLSLSLIFELTGS